MMQRHNGWCFWGWTSTAILGLWACALADVTFNTFSSQLIFKTSASQLLLGKAQNISGWSDLSIAKDFGRNTPASWVEGFASGAIISQSGGTAVPQIHLIVANSNAVTWTGAYPTPPAVTQNSVDGTTYVQYEPNHHIFHDSASWTVKGWVRFNNGFTIMPQASVLMDTLTTVSGPIDLRDTGLLILNNDLYLSHNVTLTSGGRIQGKRSQGGQANTIFMGGDLTIAEAGFPALHITGDWNDFGPSNGETIIDGQGHTLNIQDNAQIFIDQNVTLTLRNMTIRTGARSINISPIRLASTGSKLALDNVIFDLGADLQIEQGQLFIHNEVAVTGTSAFIYNSPNPSYITSGATWSFEVGTTFSIAPATFTDIPYTVGGASASNNFIVLADQSSALSLSGCTLKTTYTGARLSRGMVLFDNKVSVDTQAAVDVSNTPATTSWKVNPAPSPAPEFMTWSPDGRFIGLVYYTSANKLDVYRFNGSSNPTLAATIGTGTRPQNLAWSPDGKYVAVVNVYFAAADSGRVQVFKFDGKNTLTNAGGEAGAGTAPRNVSWSPDGRFLAVTATNNPFGLYVYRFTGTTPSLAAFYGATGNSPVNVYWSPDGRFLVVASTSGYNSTQVFRFNGSNSLTYVGPGIVGNTTYDAEWSPDGRFVAELYQALTGSLQIDQFTGGGLGSVAAIPVSPYPYCLDWSPDGRFLVVITYQTSGVAHIFRFDGKDAPYEVGTINLPGHAVNAYWSPNGKFLAFCCSGDTLYVYRINFISRAAADQTFASGLLFGDKAKGPAYDADVRMLGGAAVTVKGMVSDDSA